MKKDVFTIQASRGLTQAFIIDGQILHQSLNILGKDEEWVKEVLISHNIREIQDVFFAQIDELGNIYIDVKNDVVPNQFQ